MDRLTIPDERIDGGKKRCSLVDARAAKEEAMTIYWRLKKYEDTGLTPEEINSLNNFDGSQAVKATKMLQEEQRKHRWIPVSEQLPEYSGMYLACLDDGYITSVEYVEDERGTQDWELWADSGEVVAWMPLPEPYRSESQV